MNALRRVRRPMRRPTVALAMIAALVVVAGVVIAQEIPSFAPADQPIPVPRPADGQQVAVIQVALEGTPERVTAEVLSAVVIDGFAPKVVARSAGDWQVRVIGENELRYLIPNPLLDIESDGEGEDPNDPYDQVILDTYEWTLIVPMYDQGASLGATSVEVTDLASGDVILATELTRG